MSRLPAIDREALGPGDQAIWDKIAAGRSGTVRGPYGALMHVPALAARVAAVQDYFTSQGELGEIDRELLILTAVREIGAKFAWARHEARAHALNVRSEVIEALRARAGLDALTGRECLLVEMARGLVRDHQLPAQLYDRALAELGQTQLVEAVTLVGLYGLIGLVIQGFEVPTAPDDPPTF